MVELFPGLVSHSLRTEPLEPLLRVASTEKDSTHPAEGQRYTRWGHCAALHVTRSPHRRDPGHVVDTKRATCFDISVPFLERARATCSHDAPPCCEEPGGEVGSAFQCLLADLRGAIALKKLLTGPNLTKT